MPANLSPEYKNAESAFKKARDPKERLDCLREMLRTIPKHKGTEHLQADIKTRIKNLTEELAGPKKGGARTGPLHAVRPEGAAQVALIGPPNTGKSALHDKLTGSHAESGPYPFTTQEPLPGMLAFEDINIQLVDLPPVAEEHTPPWIVNALQPADACLLIVDITDPACVEQLLAARRILAEKRVSLVAEWRQDEESEDGDEAQHETQHAAQDDEIGDPFALRLPTLLVANKADLMTDRKAELEAFLELSGVDYPAVCVSAATGEGLDQIGRRLFDGLGIKRVYTKAPGRSADLGQPFTVRAGGTVHDVAVLVHKDIAESFKYARLWGSGHFKGQQVGRDHRVQDGDVIELHT